MFGMCYQTMAATEKGAKEMFFQFHDKANHSITNVQIGGLYNNNGRYSKYFKAA